MMADDYAGFWAYYHLIMPEYVYYLYSALFEALS
jgi:hypothetical protein